MSKCRSYIILFITAMAMVGSRLDAGTLTALVDKTVGTVDDQFVYTISISGKADEPVIPKVQGLQISKVGTSQSYSMQGFGSMTRKVEYRYVVVATKEGTYTIPSVSLKVDGDLQKTAPIRITVSNAASSGGGDDGDDAPPMFIQRDLKKNEVYTGEQVISKVKIYSRLRLLEAANISENSSDFRRYNSKKENRYQKMHQGMPYDVIEVAEAYVPLKAGRLSLPAFKLKTKVAVPRKQNSRRSRDIFDDFFGGSMFGGSRSAVKVVRSKDDEIVVKPLPKEGRPSQFSNLVGQFGIDASLSSQNVDAGDTVTLTVDISGTGVLSGMNDLALEFDPSIKIYPDKPTLSERFQEGVGVVGTRTLKYALVPTVPGEYKIPDIVVHVFDPSQGKYVALKKSVGLLQVGGKADIGAVSSSGSSNNQKKRVKVLSEDIMSFYQGEKLSANQVLTRSDFILIVTLSLLPVFLVLGLTIFSPIYRRYSTSENQRQSKAWLQYRSAIKGLGHSPDDFLAKVKQLRLYIGSKWDRKGGALTDHEIYQYLSSKSMEEAWQNKLKEVLTLASKVEYAGSSMSEDQLVKSMDLLDQLAKEVKRV